MDDMKISRTQEDKFKALSHEKRALDAMLDEVMNNITTRLIEVNRLGEAVWDEIKEQFDLDEKTTWAIDPKTRIIKEQTSTLRRKKKRGFFDMMDDHKDTTDTSA